MTDHKIVSESEWTEARRKFLDREKELTQLQEKISEERRALPWVKVEKEYTFEGPNGPETLADLFEGRSQLVVYHFMFDPRNKEGCHGCSFWADNFNPIIVHLNQRDVTMVAVSRASLKKLDAFKARMGWNFKWVSCGESDFNYDYHVSFTAEEQKRGRANYNYKADHQIWMRDMPGASVFYRNKAGEIFHTFSCFSRGIDMQNTAYQYLDLVPKGRDEAHLDSPMAWLDYHDKY